METRRWTNHSHPQTLQIGVMLLYLGAVFGVVFGNIYSQQFGVGLGLLASIGLGAAGFGIANDQRWGYNLGVALTGLALVPFAMIIVSDGVGELFNANLLMAMIFPIARFALLVHPMSRDYQRIWFS